MTDAVLKLDRKGTQRAVGSALETYRFYSCVGGEEGERYCAIMQEATELLPNKQRTIIKQLMDKDKPRDYEIYNHVFDPPISEHTFYKLKWDAIKRLALCLNIAVYVQGVRG